MSRFVHILFHVVVVAANVGQLASGAIPAPYNLIVSAVLGGIQAGVAIYNHAPAKVS